MEYKICPKCKFPKPLTEFHRNKKKPDGHQSWCKLCNRNSIVKSYKSDPQRFKDRASANKTRIQQLLLCYLKEHPCVDCGEADSIVLEFDHLEGKDHNISHMVSEAYSWENISKEIEKCVVRCANCHRRKTAKDYNHYKYRLLNAPIAAGGM